MATPRWPSCSGGRIAWWLAMSSGKWSSSTSVAVAVSACNPVTQSGRRHPQWTAPSALCLVVNRLLLRSIEAGPGGAPIDHVPPGVHVIGALILVAQVVRMLPDVDAENRRHAVHERRVLVRRLDRDQLAVAAQSQPLPAAAELPERVFLNLGFERVEPAECGLDGVAEGARWFTATIRGHDFPKQRVVGMPAAIIAHGGADRLGHGRKIPHQLVDRLRQETGLIFERLIQLVHLRLVLAAVMDFHRQFVDGLFQRVGRIRQTGQREWHDYPPVEHAQGSANVMPTI